MDAHVPSGPYRFRLSTEERNIMHKRLLITAAGLTLGATGLLAQPAGTPAGGRGLQTVGTLIAGPMTAIPPISSRVITGSPFSGLEESKTTQTLGDGTIIENSQSSTVYRDTEG